LDSILSKEYMKLRYWFVLPLLFVIGFISWSDDYILVPENFFMHKGDSLNVHLFTADAFDHVKELRYEKATTDKFALYDDGKIADMKSAAKDGAKPILGYKMNTNGLAMLEMVRNYPPDDIDRVDFATDLESEGMVALSDKVNKIGQNRVGVKYTYYLKSLVMVDKPNGNIYAKELNHDLEITLKENPYKLSYGDNETAQVKFKKKPLGNAKVDLLIKTSSGKVYPQRFVSDADGYISFSVNREGIYLLRLAYVEPSKIKTADYEKWGAAFSFAFSNNGTLPATKEFGLGTTH